jgi:signal transduction histidine kinase
MQQSKDVDIDPSDADAVSRAAAELGFKGDRWTTGRNPDTTLLLAWNGPDSPELLDICATILGLASERSADASAARSNAMLQERARIASVIHEGITQVLTNVAIQMEILEQLMADPDAAHKMIKALREAVLEALDSLRGAILELNPTAPEWTDLAGGLERFTTDFGAQWGMTVAYEVGGDPREVESETIAVVFGFVQEALTNVRKHAAGASTKVRLDFTRGMISVDVADDGPGFDPSSGDEAGFRIHQGLGLTRSRINLAGGRFIIESSEGSGTTLRLEIAG